MGLSPSCNYDAEDNTEETELKNAKDGENSNEKKGPKSAMKQSADNSNKDISFSSLDQIKEGDILIVKETFETRCKPKETIRLGWKLKVHEIDKEDKMILVADFEKKILKNQQWCTYFDVVSHLAPDNPRSQTYVEELVKKEKAANEKETLKKLFRYEVLNEFDVENGGSNTKKITKDMIVLAVGTREEDNAWEITVEGEGDDRWFVTKDKINFLKQLKSS